jgi:spermidine synthase
MAPTGRFIAAYVFFSGFCSLTYQVIWERCLKSVFGGDVASAAVIVSIFLLGMGLGGYLFRNVGHHALLVLAGFETAIGIFGFGSFGLVPGAGELASAVMSGTGSGASGLATGALGSMIFLALPTFLMGGTLPLMFQSFLPSRGADAKSIGSIYGINVLGAFAGAILPPLVFGTWGLPLALKATAGINLFLGIVLFRRFVKSRDSGPSGAPLLPPTAAARKPGYGRFLEAFAFLSGFAALSFEILFFRFIGLLQGQSAYSFPIILSAYLLSMALGSIVWTKIAVRVGPRRARALPFALQAAAGSVFSLSLLLVGPLLRTEIAAYFNFPVMFKFFGEMLESGRFAMAALSVAVFCLPLLVFLAPVVFVTGGIFPALIQRLSESRRSAGLSAGILYFWNSLGCTLGSLATAFLLIPWLGWFGAAVAVSGLSVVGGISGISAMRRAALDEAFPGRGKPWNRRAAIALLAVLPAGLFFLSDPGIKYKIASGTYSAYLPLEAYREGATGVAMAVRRKAGRRTVLDIYADGFLMSELPSPRFAYIANLPRLQERLESVLILGLGGGQNVADLLGDPRVKRLVVVDWSREIIDLVSTMPVAKFNRNPFSDPRLRIVEGDARLAVKLFAREPGKFDAVINNLCFPGWAGAGAVTSVQFFRSVRDILAPGGFYYHVPNASDSREWDLVLDTLAAVFGHIAVHNARLMICGDQTYAPRESRIRDVLTRELLARTDSFLVPTDAPPDKRYEEFLSHIERIDAAALPNAGILTDERPAAEYPISLPSLWGKILKGVKDPTPLDPERRRR